MDDIFLPPRNAVVCIRVVNCNVADDISVNLYVCEKSQSGGVVLGAVSIMVYVCELLKHNDCNIELKK